MPVRELLIIDPDPGPFRDMVAAAWPQIGVHTARTAAEALPYAGQVEMVATLAHLLNEEIASAFKQVKWVQAFSTGTDGITRLKAMRRDIILTSGRGAHGPQMSEMAFAHMLVLARRLDRMVHNKDRKAWDRWTQPLLFDKTAAIVGTGAISNDLALRCKAFGMHVIGVTATVRPIEHFDEVVGREDLVKALGRADFTVILLPLDAYSKGLFDAKLLAAIKPGGFLINLGRGGIVDEAALRDALGSGAIAGAGLDVFAKEPLPQDDPMWDAPNTFITPHLGGLADIYHRQIGPILMRNLKAYMDGRPDEMINRVW